MQSGEFIGYHSEWNLGSPGGWDYQRITQEIGQAVWTHLRQHGTLDLKLDFCHPLFSPVDEFIGLLADVHRAREGNNPGLIAVVAEEETLDEVVENKNLARRISRIDGLEGILTAPQGIELLNGRVCWRRRPVSVIFMDFNTDVLLSLHRKHDLTPVLQAVRENRVINPRGTEPINVKSVFELITDPEKNRPFSKSTVAYTPWTRRFFDRRTSGPEGEPIADLLEWTRTHWGRLVLKPARGYSGKGVQVGGVHPDADAAIALALESGDYIVQQKVPLSLWAEEMPELDKDTKRISLTQYQTDFRCLFGPDRLVGFVGRYGQVPTNVGSGGGFQPLAILASDMSVAEATRRINDAILAMEDGNALAAIELQEKMAMAEQFTYLLGPVKIALRPRLLTAAQMESLADYCAAIWKDCLTLEKMWMDGQLDDLVDIEPEELAIARSQPWNGSPALLASDGIFSFGAHLESL